MHWGYFVAGVSFLLVVVFEGGDWMSMGCFLLFVHGFFVLVVSGIVLGTQVIDRCWFFVLVVAVLGVIVLDVCRII